MHKFQEGRMVKEHQPVCFIKNNDLLPTFWQSDFLLSKHFNLVPHYINSSFIRCI